MENTSTLTKYYNFKIPKPAKFPINSEKQEGIRRYSFLKYNPLIGLECELENVNFISDEKIIWNTEPDHSLKLNGLEFTTPILASDTRAALIHLHSIVKSTVSDRCSVHVHLNISNWTMEQVETLLLLYVIFEPQLFYISGNRNNNNYCVPIRDTFLPLRDKGLFSHPDILADYLTKYTAIHFLPMHDTGRIGTMEFRHMKGTKDINLIELWVKVITELTYAVSKYSSVKQLKEELKDLRYNSHYYDLFVSVFPETKDKLIYPDFHRDIEQGITFSRLIGE